jgi:hypothetical protein
MFQVNQDSLQLDGSHHLVHADDVDILREGKRVLHKTTQLLLFARKETGT